MISRNITMPELGMIAGTRVALGAGIGLLMADRLNDDQRRAVGWTLLAVGAITTIPLFAEVMSRRELGRPSLEPGRAVRASVGATARNREMALTGL
jgi:hypothetical protein